ncbi:transmembrane protein 198-like isoform X3 [Balaenoptera ricei]|uniref:transmembrane protein 198-like isoform X3 n=1 Tax=Balaenoptera ricei TaxID=2746895 RepID=UPI0028BD894F|nr:transmembrane protein 198-like isoform X3 [Balaenoptera ricei]
MEEALLPLAMTSDPRPFNQQLPEPPDPRCVLEPQDNPELAPALVCALCCCFGIIYCCFEPSLETSFCLSVPPASLPRLPLLQGSDVSLRPAIRSPGDLPAVPQGACARDTAEPGVLGTALLGAAVLVACADYFLEGLALGSRLGQRLQALPALPPLCWYSWVLLGTWPALGALGALAQWKLMDEERGGHTNAVVLSHQRRHLQLLRIRQQEAKWHRTSPGVGLCEGSYRRPLHPSARSPADSLAPSYLQSLREHQLGPGTQATAPHTVLDLDSDCGSTVPLTTPSGSTRT